VIGAGAFGRHHASKYRGIDGVELIAVADPCPEVRKTSLANHGVHAVADWRDLLGKVDLVSVCSPAVTHAAIVRAFLNAGANVLVEKPIATSVEEADALIALARSAGRVLTVGHQERFVFAGTGLLDSREVPLDISCWRMGPWTGRSADVSVVLDLMIHDLDVILSMVPSAVRAVEAVGVPVLSSSVDIANARLRFANGCIANLTASRVSLKRERKMRIFQPDAYLAVDYGERRVRICRREPGADGQAALVLEDREVVEADALETEIDAFVRAVRGRAAPLVSGWDGLRALEVAHVIRESLATEVRAAQVARAG